MNKEKQHMQYSCFLYLIFGVLMAGVSSCNYRTQRNETAETVETISSDARQPLKASYVYEVFLENSGSMDGYVRGVTVFEDDLYKLLVDISYLADTVNVNYVNSQVIPYQAGIQSFINNLEPATFRQRGGNRSSSNLNQVFEKALGKVGDEKVALLISDGIFSIGGGDTEEKLTHQKISIYNTFRSKLQREAFATLIIKLTSEFNGSYYDKNNRPVNLNGIPRPYYVWLMGKQEAIEQFRNQIRFHTLEGFRNTYMLVPSSAGKTPFYTVLNNYNKTGSFRSDRDYSGSNYVHGIQNAEPASRGEREGQFGLSVAIDMSHIPVDEEYLMNKDNYQITDAYILENVQPVETASNLNGRDKTMIEGKATHIITVKAKGMAIPDLNIALRRQTPAWVDSTQTNDDTSIKKVDAQQEKTFGFGYLVEGIEEAYQNVFGRNAYFSFKISIKK